MSLVPDWLQTIECHQGTRKELPAPVMTRRRQSGDSLLSLGENGARRLRVNAELSLSLYSILSSSHTIFVRVMCPISGLQQKTAFLQRTRSG